MSGVCDEVLSHEERGSSPQINTFFNFLPSRMSPHNGGTCLLSSIEGKGDAHDEEYKEGEALASGVLDERVDISFENDSVGPCLRSLELDPDSSPEEGSSR